MGRQNRKPMIIPKKGGKTPPGLAIGKLKISPKKNKQKESGSTARNIYAIIIGLILFLSFLTLLQPQSANDLTGRFIFPTDGETRVFATTLTTIALLIVLLFLYLNRGSIKELLKNIISSIAIFAGIFTIVQFVPNLELFIILLTVTFGIMAMIWTVRAKYSLSLGSSLRSFISHFFYCLLFLLLFSIYDSAIAILQLKGPLVYGRYVLIAIAYTVFVSASYKILKMGREFGFEAESRKIATLISKAPVQKPAAKRKNKSKRRK